MILRLKVAAKDFFPQQPLPRLTLLPTQVPTLRLSIMEAENAIDHLSEDQGGVTTVNQTQDVIGELINEAKEQAEAHIDGTKDTAIGVDSVGKESKKSNSPENDAASHDNFSGRVREGQRWNDRPRKFDNKNDRKPYKYGNKHDRAQYKKNIKSDLTSQQESSDPVAIRKQVGSPVLSSNCTNLKTEG